MLGAALFCELLALGTWAWQATGWLMHGTWEPLRVGDLVGHDLHRIMAATGPGHWLIDLNPGLLLFAVGVALFVLRRRAVHI